MIVLPLLGGHCCAMNWEGHEDWLAEHPVAAEYRIQLALPPAAPAKDLLDCEAMVSRDNPYEQIPAGKTACRAKVGPAQR